MLQLQGCFTAIVTPFRNGKVDYKAFKALVEEQIAGGVAGLVPVGTTGESPTLSYKEHNDVIEKCVEYVNRRCLVIAGTGANSTDEALELTQHAAKIGADATLQVTPYYNKPSSEGLYRHFSAVADKGGLPVVLYNVPGRAGRDIDLKTVQRLGANPNIVAIKEAAGSVDRVSQILEVCPKMTVLSGDDSLTIPMMAIGAKGIISVASNLVPAAVSAMVGCALRGEWDKAREWHHKLYPLFRDIFVETNPIPIKAAMAMTGKIAEEYRLPLCEIGEANREILRAAMKKAGVNV